MRIFLKSDPKRLRSADVPSLFTEAELDGIPEEEISEEDRVSQTYKNRKTVEDKINFNVKSIGIEIVEDLSITGEVGQTMITVSGCAFIVF